MFRVIIARKIRRLPFLTWQLCEFFTVHQVPCRMIRKLLCAPSP